MKVENTLFLLLVISFVVAVAGCSSNNTSNEIQQVKTSTESQTSIQQATQASTPVTTSTSTPTPTPTPTPEVTSTPEVTPAPEATPIPEVTPTPTLEATPTPTLEATPTPTLEATPAPEVTPTPTLEATTTQLPESKREELIGYAEQYSGSKDVTVVFIPTTNGGTMCVDFTLNSVPNSEYLNNNIADIIIASKAVAQESGIQNTDVSVCAKLESGRGLGLGSYFASTDKTSIDVSDCHP